MPHILGHGGWEGRAPHLWQSYLLLPAGQSVLAPEGQQALWWGPAPEQVKTAPTSPPCSHSCPELVLTAPTHW